MMHYVPEFCSRTRLVKRDLSHAASGVGPIKHLTVVLLDA